MVASSSGQQSFSSSTSVFSLFRVPDVRYCLNFMLLRVARLMCASVREIRPLLPAGMLFLLLCGQCRENCFFECLPPHFPPLPGCSEILSFGCRFIFRFIWFREVAKKLKFEYVFHLLRKQSRRNYQNCTVSTIC